MNGSSGRSSGTRGLPGLDAFDAKNVILMERRPIRSGAQVLTFVTDRKPTHAGVDPFNYYIDRNSSDNVLRLGDPGSGDMSGRSGTPDPRLEGRD